MIDILHNFGLCVSYLERTNSEARAADQLGTDLPDIDIDLFFHFVANNVDHNSGTINDTFNHIGAIACTTNAKMYQLPAIKRTTIKRSEIIKTAKPERKFLDFSYDIKPLKVFKDICCNVTLGKTKVLSNLWQYLWLVSPMKPLWNGFIKAFHESHRPSKTAIHFEPMIDIPSSDFSCIYSTMSFVSDLARKYGHDPVLAFDQPLYWKAMEITIHKQQKSSFIKMVIMLCTFHTCIHFYGSISSIMAGYDTQSLLELTYAEHTTPHILSSKAFDHAT